MSTLTSSRLTKAVQFLAKEAQYPKSHPRCHHHADPHWVPQLDTWGQLEVMRQLLCQRPPTTPIPTDILENIDAAIKYHNNHNITTSSASITPQVVTEHPVSGEEKPKIVRLSLWKGDITTLTDVTAIVNAANSGLLGCFRPEHRCIDNVIHSAAGPRLRHACHTIMLEQGYPEPAGAAKVTPGFNLPSQYVLHTVGPQLGHGQKPELVHREQLSKCYISCLESANSLPALPDGRKVLVFCCISTGLFAFPPAEAAKIAVQTVAQWIQENPSVTLTDIIFDTFLQRDYELYVNQLTQLQDPKGATVRQPTPKLESPAAITSPMILTARNWLKEADFLIITAGAGLSAAIGLDYTSRELFQKHFPAFTNLGLNRLYDVFGFTGWESLGQKWGYYFLHLDMVQKWPASQLYTTLRTLANRFPTSKYFVRTSNADGQFVNNGFLPERISTPQGQYQFLQCYAKCRPDAVFPSGPFVDAALPFIDEKTQALQDESKVPRCKYCGGELTLCVRGGDYFNPSPFRAQEREWTRFADEVSQQVETSPSGPTAVILELGVGLNTPGVLRWPNEDLVAQSRTGGYRLIRAGLGVAGCVPWELEEQDLAVGITGDLNTILEGLVN
ncbi:hypothetical protein BJX96DRAFT_162335 [Aspergillus floccosus]